MPSSFEHVGSNQSSHIFVKYRILLILVSQIVLIAASYYCSFLLRLDVIDSATRAMFWGTVPFVLAIKLLVFYYFGLLRGWWRYVGMGDVFNITGASGLSSSLIYALIVFGLRVRGYPRSVVVIDMLLTMALVGGARIAVRAYTERAKRYDGQKNTLIVGAGRAGRAIVQQLRSNPNLPYYCVGLIDDNRSKLGITIDGVRVLGTTDELTRLITVYNVECVLIAIPSATGRVVQNIIDKCRENKVSFSILPPITEMLGRPASVQQARKLRVDDLLNRQAIELDLEQIRGRLQDNVLLISGAGGSIGSEMARQVAAFSPRKLVLLDRSENDLFKICMDLSSSFPDLTYLPIVGDILDVTHMRQVFGEHRPNSVFHAAAYKHVPMMEENCFQAVVNNIFGTYNMALLAKQYEVENFVLISSDKAVNPTNIMGVTKRVAEKIILALQHNVTRFMAVRFGNVLGSNGSVLTIFQEQIARGGPVTVTHRDATRYFMTTREAVQLVLQASTMGKGGEIFVLDMGEAVKIIDLADRTIRLAGFRPNDEIKIVFTGLRPGEKLFEELKLDSEETRPTPHKKIRVLDGGGLPFHQVRAWLEDLSTLVESRNVHGMVAKLVSIVPEYTPSDHILARAEFDRHDQSFNYKQARSLLASSAKEIA